MRFSANISKNSTVKSVVVSYGTPVKNVVNTTTMTAITIGLRNNIADIKQNTRKEQTMDKNTTHICSICGKKFTGYGNDPWPVKDKNGNVLPGTARCCDACNLGVVVPLRISQLKK